MAYTKSTVWKDLTAILGKVAGVWKTCDKGWGKVSGAWVPIYYRQSYFYGVGLETRYYNEGSSKFPIPTYYVSMGINTYDTEEGEVMVGAHEKQISSLEYFPDQLTLFPIVAQAACYRHHLVITNKGDLYSWGSNIYGELGYEPSGGIEYEREVTYVPRQVGTSKWKMVSVSQVASAGIQANGDLYTWGANTYGQLGHGTTTPTSTPTKVGTAKWKAISMSEDFTFGIQENGDLYGWGRDLWDVLGGGGDELEPLKIGSDKWVAVSSGWFHVLAINEDGDLYAWGSNSYGRLGLGDTTARISPTKVGSDKWKAISASLDFSLAIKDNGDLCFAGRRRFGVRGDGGAHGGADYDDTFVQIGTAKWKAVDTGLNFCAGIQEDDSLHSWGYNEKGQCGVGNTSVVLAPEEVVSGRTAHVAAGEQRMFAATYEELV